MVRGASKSHESHGPRPTANRNRTYSFSGEAIVTGLLALASFLGGVFMLMQEGSPDLPQRPPPPPGDDPDERWLKAIHPEAAECFRKVLAQVRAEGFRAVIVSGKRNCQEQRKIYQQGRFGNPGPIVTHANGCSSWHVQGRAIDLAFPKGQEAGYKRAGELCEELGGKWGGHFNGFYDGPHLEYHPGLTIEMVCPNPDDCSKVPA
jgi:hypothetical protein